MNASHKVGKLRNRLKRCEKRLTDKDLPSEQRGKLVQRQSELQRELK